MLFSASKIELAIKCPSAFALPHNDVRTVEADAGKERHSEHEDAINDGDIPAVLESLLPGGEWRAEVKLAYDISTLEGRELGQGSDRAYGALGPFEVPGTADAIGRLGNRVVVVDWKSYDDVTKASDNPQLKLLALAAARAYDVDQVEVVIVHLLRGTDRAELDALDLDAFASELREIHLDVMKARHDQRAGVPPTFTVGRQCRYCPAFDACPKQKDLIALVQGETLSLQVEQSIPISQNDEAAADMYELWKRIGMLHKRIGAALYARAAEQPIPLHSGKVFGKVTSLGNEKLDGDVVYEVVKTRHGQAIADTAVIRSATKVRLREALGFVGAKSVAAAERDVLTEVRAKGGSKRETKESIEEHAPHVPQLKEQAP